MRITLLTTWNIVKAVGGAERVFCSLANAMVERGHQVTGVCFEYASGPTGFPLDERVHLVNAGEGKRPPLWLSKAAINLRSLSFSREKRRTKRLLLWESYVGQPIASAVEATKPDVVVAFRTVDVHIVQRFCGSKFPIVAMDHNSTDVFLPWGTPKEIKQALERCAAVQVLMPGFVGEVKRLLPQANVTVIPNAVPQFKATADRAVHTIVNVARITPEKQQNLLVEAFSLIADRYPDWQVQFWGDNSVEPECVQKLKTLIEQKHLSDRIHLCGNTNRVEGVLANASVFAFPSHREGFGLALAEAMAMGLPAVGLVTCPAVNQLIKPMHNGLLCDPTPESFADALSQLMDNETLRVRLGNAAKEDMKAYDADKVWSQWESVLRSVKEQSNEIKVH